MTQQKERLHRELEGGLVLRTGRSGDVERLIDLFDVAFTQGEGGPPKPECAPWARDLGSGHHPCTNLDHLYLVEDPANGKIVSSTWVLAMRWSYDGVEFAVARPEVVATHPDYRGRGLVREIFRAMHADREQAGDLALAITGIPYYYRQFGYEYALSLGGGQRVPLAHVPALPAGRQEPYRFVPAAGDDLPYLMALHERRRRGSLVWPVHGTAYWRWMIEQSNPEAGLGWLPFLILDHAGQRCGYVLVSPRRWGSTITVRECELDDGTGFAAVRDPLLRHLAALAKEIPPMPVAHPVDAVDIAFALGRAHPVYDVLTRELRPVADEPYAWFIRVPDLPKLLRHLAPVLAARLAASAWAGYTGDLAIDFYRDGLLLRFADGQLREARPRQRTDPGTAEAAFPPLVFLQMLFGHRSFDDLHAVMPDVRATPRARHLLGTLFPVRWSWAPPVT